MALTVVIMAAGKGTRMKSAQPKVLHRLAGTSLLQHVVRTVTALAADRIVVVTGHGADEVEAAVKLPGLQFVRQMPQLGTGHAVQQALPLLPDEGTVLILNGDVPLIEAETLRGLVAACDGRRLALLTITLDDPTGYGRIVRRAPGGEIRAIVEHKDADARQREIREVYTGVMAAPAARLKVWLKQLNNDNVQREYYLPDVVAMAVAEGLAVSSAQPRCEAEVLGVNSPSQLADLERRYQRARAEALMEAGVRLADPARLDVRGELVCGSDVEIDLNCIFEGRVTLGDGVRIGANCVIRDAAIDAGAEIQPFTHMEGGAAGVHVGAGARVGPFARLRPGAKANHLAYLGDSTVGERVNFGAGSITANYDGANKHRTVIGDDVHVGSNCVLVAPLTLGNGATIGGGSTIVKPVEAGQLVVARARQVTIAGWRRPVKAKKAG